MHKIIQFLVSNKYTAWIVAIGSAIATAWVMWVASKKVNVAEAQVESTKAQAKEEIQWNATRAVQSIQDERSQNTTIEKAIIQANVVRDETSANTDVEIIQELQNKWSRD